ncbi:hypothetical protein T484DRAFT_1798814, partial [Baffinella frigidus]
EHFVAVQWVPSLGWEHVGDHGAQTFAPAPGDLLVAAVNFSSRVLTPLAPSPTNTRTHGIASGFKSGDLTFVMDSFGGVPNYGEFEVRGGELLVSPDTLDARQLAGRLGAYRGGQGGELPFSARISSSVSARYTYQSWRDSPDGAWLDASGNGNHANVSRGGLTGEMVEGHGARGAVGSVLGGVSDGVRLADFPGAFSVCVVSRYAGAADESRRIVDAVEDDALLGHAGGESGVVSLGNGGASPTTGPVRPPTDWLVLCGRNAKDAGVYFTANGVTIMGGGEARQNLTENFTAWSVNDGQSGEHSGWAVSEIVVWDAALSNAEVDAAASMLRARLAFGDAGWDALWDRPAGMWPNAPPSINTWLTVAGVNFGASDLTVMQRRGGTACESTEWSADSALRCRTATAVEGTKKVMITMGARVGSVSEAASYDLPMLSMVKWTNRAGTGSTSVTIQGVNFYNVDSTASIRVGFTAGEATEWESDTSGLDGICFCDDRWSRDPFR